MKKIFNYKKIFSIIFLTTMFISCSDELDTTSGRYATGDQVKESSLGGQSLTEGAYSFLFDQSLSTRHDYFGLASIMLSTDLTGQDINQVVHHWFGWDYKVQDRNATYSRTRNNWNFLYKLVNISNSIIKSTDPNSSDDNVRFSSGQGYALRAFAYHYLVRLYQHTYKGHEDAPGVPIYTEVDAKGKPRATVKEVYDFMVSDLKTAVKALKGFERPNKSVININVAQGILARVYLDMEEWDKAAEFAKKAREGYPLMSSSAYKSGFNDINNQEWIWGSIMSVESFKEGGKYQTFVAHMATTTPGYTGLLGAYKAIDKKLYEQIADTDVRKEVFFFEKDPEKAKYPNYSNNKFIDVSGAFDMDIVYMRAAEMYLIEAECKARLGSGGADELYELVHERNPKYKKSTKTGDELVKEVILQRRIELWGEGFGWFDLKRLKKGIDRSYEDSNHREKVKADAEDNATFVYQIPITEFESNPNIKQQND